MTVREAQKQAKNVCLGFFWAYVRQPHDHIGWATSIPFASINGFHPRTNPWNFWKWELAVLKVLSRKFWFFFFKKICFCFIPMNSVNVSWVSRLVRIFFYQAKLDPDQILCTLLFVSLVLESVLSALYSIRYIFTFY